MPKRQNYTMGPVMIRKFQYKLIKLLNTISHLYVKILIFFSFFKTRYSYIIHTVYLQSRHVQLNKRVGPIPFVQFSLVENRKISSDLTTWDLFFLFDVCTYLPLTFAIFSWILNRGRQRNEMKFCFEKIEIRAKFLLYFRLRYCYYYSTRFRTLRPTIFMNLSKMVQDV